MNCRHPLSCSPMFIINRKYRFFVRSFCSHYSDVVPPLREHIFLRREHFNSNRSNVLRRNERSPFVGHRQRPIVTDGDCATLVLICRLGSPPAATQSWILFTQRAKRMSEHANEISFPGGRIDRGESVETAAIREAEEEIGIDRRHLELWGTLRPLYLRNMANTVTPVVAAIQTNATEKCLSSLKCADAEVQYIFVASVADLLSRVRYTTFRFPGKCDEHQMPFYYQLPIFHSVNPRLLCNPSSIGRRSQNFQIWGLTAFTLLEALNSILPEDAKERQATDLLKTTKMTKIK